MKGTERGERGKGRGEARLRAQVWSVQSGGESATPIRLTRSKSAPRCRTRFRSSFALCAKASIASTAINTPETSNLRNFAPTLAASDLTKSSGRTGHSRWPVLEAPE